MQISHAGNTFGRYPAAQFGTVKIQNLKVIAVIAQIYLLLQSPMSGYARTSVVAVAAEMCRKCVSACAFPGQISILEKLNNKTKTKCGFSTIKLFNASNDIHFWRELRLTHTFGRSTYVHSVQASPIRLTSTVRRCRCSQADSRCFVTG